MASTRDFLQIIRDAVSSERMATYERSSMPMGSGEPAAIALYAWNAMVASAFLAPIHICEVVIRNTVSEALTSVYGPRWPWERAFTLSLPDPRPKYSPRRDLLQIAQLYATTGKVIPELKFAFWESMFTARHDTRLWLPHLKQVFPAAPAGLSVNQLRGRIYNDLMAIRGLRNRIAHHEPVFQRNLAGDYQNIVQLVSLKSPLLSSWLAAHQSVVRVLGTQPRFSGGTLWDPPEEEIRTLAYQIWQQRVSSSNGPESDWSEALKQLRGL